MKTNEKDLERSQRIVTFLIDMPILSKRHIESELKMSDAILSKACRGVLNIPSKYLDSLEDYLKKFGFKVVHTPYTYMQDLKKMIENQVQLFEAIRDYGEPSNDDLEFLDFIDNLEETVRKSKFYWQPKLKEDTIGEFERDPETGDFFVDPEHEKTRPEGV